MYPIVIEIREPHNLEPSAIEGKDFHRYVLIDREELLEDFKGVEIKIIATRVKLFKQKRDPGTN